MNTTVFVPGLFTAFKEITPPDIDALSCAALSRLLSRANKQIDSSINNADWLYQQFNQTHDAGRSIPVAAITALQDGLDSKAGYWMRADPVYLQADTRSLIMQDPALLKLGDDEVQSIADLISPLFDDYGAQLLTPDPGRWYLQFDTQAPDIFCTALHKALSKPVNDLLPQGEDRRRWHTLLNEIQMLLNQCEMTQQREANHLQPINSLWFWGEGSFPDALKSPYDYCIGDGAFLSGLCQATDTLYITLDSKSIQAMSADTEVLIVDERLQHAVSINSPERWLQALQTLEQETIAPLIEALLQRKIKSITLRDGDKTMICNARQIKSFWKPLRKLSVLLK